MKRQSTNCTSLCDEIREAQHNINKLLDYLSAGQSLKLPPQLHMSSIKIQGMDTERRLDSGKINQVWRYGGNLIKSSHSSEKEDELIEKHLIRISKWINQELNA